MVLTFSHGSIHTPISTSSGHRSVDDGAVTRKIPPGGISEAAKLYSRSRRWNPAGAFARAETELPPRLQKFLVQQFTSEEVKERVTEIAATPLLGDQLQQQATAPLPPDRKSYPVYVPRSLPQHFPRIIETSPAEQYFLWLDALVKEQAPSKRILCSMLQLVVAAVLASTMQTTSFALKCFGSRVYGCALPNSDLDIVCELPAHFCRRQDFLERTLQHLRLEPHCTAFVDAIVHKNIIAFRFAELRVDFTAYHGDVFVGHGPSRTTDFMKTMLWQQAPLGKRLVRLVVDAVKRAKACHTGTGSINKSLKGIHWAMLALAWWKALPESEEDVNKISLDELPTHH